MAFSALHELPYRAECCWKTGFGEDFAWMAMVPVVDSCPPPLFHGTEHTDIKGLKNVAGMCGQTIQNDTMVFGICGCLVCEVATMTIHKQNNRLFISWYSGLKIFQKAQKDVPVCPPTFGRTRRWPQETLPSRSCAAFHP